MKFLPSQPAGGQPKASAPAAWIRRRRRPNSRAASAVGGGRFHPLGAQVALSYLDDLHDGLRHRLVQPAQARGLRPGLIGLGNVLGKSSHPTILTKSHPGEPGARADTAKPGPAELNPGFKNWWS